MRVKLLRSSLIWVLGILSAGSVAVALAARMRLQAVSRATALAKERSSTSLLQLQIPVASNLEEADEGSIDLATATPFERDVRLAVELIRRWVSKGWVRWLFALGAAVGIVGLGLNLNPNYANMLAGALVLITGLVIVRYVARAPLVTNQVERLRSSPIGQWVAEHRRISVFILTEIALVLVFTSAYLFRPDNPQFVLLHAAGLLAVGGVVLGAAAYVGNLPAWPTPVDGANVRLSVARPALKWLLLGCLALMVLVGIRLLNTPLPWEGEPTHDTLALMVLLALKNINIPFFTNTAGEVQFALLALGVLMIALGLGAVRLPLVHRMLFLVGLFMLVLLSEINGQVYHILAFKEVSEHVQFALLCGSLTFMVIGVGRVSWPQPRIDWQTVSILALIVALGLFVRFWQMETTVRMLVDELFFTKAVFDLNTDPAIGLLTPYSSISAFPYVYPYFQEHTVALFGHNFTGLRGASAIIGAVMIALMYPLGKTLFDRKTALLGALVLAVYPPHVHFSRLGVIEIGGALAGMLALLFLARAVLNNRRLDYVLAGVMLGLTHYFHEGARLLFTPLALLWVAAVLIVWRVRGRWVYLALFLVMMVIVALPIYYTLIGIGRPLFARLTDSEVNLPLSYFADMFASGDFMPHISTFTYQSFLVYIHQIDTSLFYGPVPLTTVYMVPLLLLGFCFVMWRWRTPAALLLLLWVASTSLGNNVLTSPAHSPRYVVVFPALALIVAVGIRYTIQVLVPIRVLRAVLAGVVILGMVVLEVNYYFTDHLPLYNRYSRELWGHRDAQDAAIRSLNFPTNTYVHVIAKIPPAPNYAEGLLQFMRPDLKFDYLSPDELTREYLNELDTAVDHAFYIDPDNYLSVGLLNEYFYLTGPQGSPFADVPLESAFFLYYAPSEVSQ